MKWTDIPDVVKLGRPDCQPISMGPPPGVDDEHCGTIPMLLGPADPDGLG